MLRKETPVEAGVSIKWCFRIWSETAAWNLFFFPRYFLEKLVQKVWWGCQILEFGFRPLCWCVDCCWGQELEYLYGDATRSTFKSFLLYSSLEPIILKALVFGHPYLIQVGCLWSRPRSKIGNSHGGNSRFQGKMCTTWVSLKGKSSKISGPNFTGLQ